MVIIKFDSVREILRSGNVKNVQKKPIIMQAKQMFEDFELETLEHQDKPYKGKAGDYIMIGINGEMYVCDQEIFDKTYDVKSFWDIRQYAKSSEDYHESGVTWNDTPFNDEAIKHLRLKKVSKEVQNSIKHQSGRNY